MAKQKTCFRCRKGIAYNSAYYEFIEHSKGSVVGINYAHKICWDEFLKRIGDTTEAMSVVRGLKTSLTKMGMLPPEVINI